MLHSNLDFCIESHRIREMPAIRYLIMGHLAFVHNSSRERKRIVLHSESLTEIIFSSCAVHWRGPRIVVDKDHIVAFSPPRALEVIDGVIAAYIHPRASCFENNVVVFPIEIRNLCFQRVRLEIRRRPSGSRVLAFPVCMEEKCTIRMWGCLNFVVYVKVLKVCNIILILNFNSSTGIERPIT